MNLELEGFQVLHASDGAEGLRLALDENPDLVVLDLMLPTVDGFDLLAAVRERSRAAPVLVLSARSEIRDKVEALGLGADDYVTKPFSLLELVARIRACLRRPTWTEGAGRQVRFSDIEIGLQDRSVKRNGVEVPLTAREFDLLAFLVSKPGRIFSRGHLLTAVWGYDYEGTERTVDNFIRRLRVKLERNPRRPRHFLTVRGVGYRFVP
jgi:DNA-binding response OmpR family regulator